MVSAIAALVCLGLAVVLLGVSPYLSFVAFIGAVAAVVFAERHVRSLGEAGLNHLSETVRSRLGGSAERPQPAPRPLSRPTASRLSPSPGRAAGRAGRAPGWSTGSSAGTARSICCSSCSLRIGRRRRRRRRGVDRRG